MASIERADLKKLRDLIEDIEVAMLTTVDSDGRLHTRPVETLDVDADGDIWFFTQRDSAKVDELERDVRVGLAYADNDDHAYVAISGTARLIDDREKARELWSPMARAFFPKGLDDPQLALLRVSIERAEYWQSPGQAAYLFGVARAAMTGQGRDIGENRKVEARR